MYIYLLSNGEEYSDYRVNGIVASETPIDWEGVKDRFLRLIPPDTKELFVSDELYTEIFAKLGISCVFYEEVTFDPRKKYGHGEDGTYTYLGWEIV